MSFGGSIRTFPHQATMATQRLSFLVGDLHKPSVATVTGRSLMMYKGEAQVTLVHSIQGRALSQMLSFVVLALSTWNNSIKFASGHSIYI